MRLLQSILLLQGVWLTTAVRFSLKGFSCPSQALPVPVKVAANWTGWEQICLNLTVSLVDLTGNLSAENSSRLVVEHSHLPLPGQGVVLMETPAVGSLVLSSRIDSAALTSRLNQACGTSFLIVSLKPADQVADFDVLVLESTCADSPALKLNVKTSADKPRSLMQGMANPLQALGVSGIVVENSGAGSRMAKRWEFSAPEVVVLFYPLGGPDYAMISSIIDSTGLNGSNILSNQYNNNSWFKDLPQANTKVINYLLTEVKLFSGGQFLHNASVLSLNTPMSNGMVGPVDPSSPLGLLNLTNMLLPASAMFSGILVAILDPRMKISDNNRTDNIFIEFVNVNMSEKIYQLAVDPICTVSPMNQGKSALLTYQPFYSMEPQILLYRDSAIRSILGETANKMKLNAHLSLIKSKEYLTYSAPLNAMVQRHLASVKPMINEIQQILANFTFQYHKIVGDSPSDNRTKVLRVLRFLGNGSELIKNDRTLMKIVLGSLRRLMEFQQMQNVDNRPPLVFGNNNNSQGVNFNIEAISEPIGEAFQNNFGQGKGGQGGVNFNIEAISEPIGEAFQNNFGKGKGGQGAVNFPTGTSSEFNTGETTGSGGAKAKLDSRGATPLNLDAIPPPHQMDADTIEGFMHELNKLESSQDDHDILAWSKRKKRHADDDFSADNKQIKQNPFGVNFNRELKKIFMNQGESPMNKDLSTFLRELIFSPNDDPTTMIGSRIPTQLRTDLRDIIMMFLRDEMPTDLLAKLGGMWSVIGSSIGKKAMNVLPICNNDVMNIFNNVSQRISNKTSTQDPEEKMLWTMVQELYSAFTNDTKLKIAKLATKIQGLVMLQKSFPMMTGVLGDDPSTEDLIQVFSSFILEQSSSSSNSSSSSDGKVRQRMNVPAVWKKDKGVIFKVELCPLSGKWFWTKVALCSCEAKIPALVPFKMD